MIYNAEKIEKALLSLGIVVDRIETTDRGDEVYARCPGHMERMGKEDRSASWSVNAETGLHNCFSCGYGGSLLSLVVQRLDLYNDWGLEDRDAAKRWLEQTVGLDLTGVAERLGAALKNGYIGDLPAPVEMSEARLRVFTPPPSWALEARGLTVESQHKYTVLWREDDDCWITPVRHPISFKLWGWQEKGQKARFFKNFPTNMKKSKTVFGIDTYTGGPALVVESPLDAVRVSSACPEVHGLATMGASVSDPQFDILRYVDDLYFGFDNPKHDSAGRKASKAAMDKAREGWFEPKFFAYPDDRHCKDPGDMTDAEILQGLEQARHYIKGTAAYLIARHV